jgi:hypothetical protein
MTTQNAFYETLINLVFAEDITAPPCNIHQTLDIFSLQKMYVSPCFASRGAVVEVLSEQTALQKESQMPGEIHPDLDRS